MLWKINNAGCMVHKRELNAEGLEMNFATNTMGETRSRDQNETCLKTVLNQFYSSASVGVYILTQTLIPLLQKSRDPRVVRFHA